MNRLDTVCEMLREELLEINSQLEHLEKNMEEFANMALSLPAMMVKTRLLLIGEQILRRSGSLFAEHDGEGWVFFMKSDILLGVYWNENEYSQKVKDDFKKRGFLILTLVEVIDFIAELSKKVDSGQLVEAVDWVNRYEPSFTNYLIH